MSRQPPSLHVVQHIDDADTAWIEEIAAKRGLQVAPVRPAAGQALPAPGDVDRVIVLGGPMDADDIDAHPFLADEDAWLRALLEAGVPVLGLCLGAQLLAVALEGRAERGAHGLESGYIDVVSVGEGRHPLADVLPGRHFSFHTDVSVPPEGATLLAVSDLYPQAWSLGSALALQFHAEISPAGIQTLVDHEGPKLREAGVDGHALISAARLHERSCRARADQIFGGWLDLTIPELH